MSKTGYCSLCKNPKVMLLNNAIAAGKGYTVASRELAAHDLTFAKNTFLTHKAHITSPLVTAAEEAKRNPIIKPSSNRAAVELIRDLGVQRAMDNPEEVTVAHALRAAKILADSETKEQPLHIILARAVAGPAFIEGEWKELEMKENENVSEE